MCSLSSCRPSRGLRRRKQHGHHGGHGHFACRPTAAHCHPRYHLQDRRSVPADRIAIVTSGKFGLWSTMSIFELNQAHLFWFIAECFWIRWARAGHRVSGRGDHGARRQRQRRQRERAAVRDGRAWGDARELEELLGVGAAIVDFSKKYQDPFSAPPGLVWRWPTEGSKSSKAPWGGC